MTEGVSQQALSPEQQPRPRQGARHRCEGTRDYDPRIECKPACE